VTYRYVTYRYVTYYFVTYALCNIPLCSHTSLASYVHSGGPFYPGAISVAASAVSGRGLDSGRESDVVVYVLTSNYATAQRGTSATPRRSGYDDMSNLGSFRAGVGPYGKLVWS
jgi:hypothetical protein